MTVEQILTPVITQELEKYQRDGQKIKLKSTNKKRIKYTIICGLITLCGLAHPVYFAVVPIYIYLMMNITPVKLIYSLAKKHPDKPISQIVAEEVTVL